MIVRTIEAIARMTRADRAVVVRAAARLLRERLRIRHPRLAAAGAGTAGRIDSRRATRLAHLVRRTAESVPFGSTCLHRALVLASLLRDEDLQSVLRIGVRSDRPDRLDAHAWVEHGDLSLLNEDASAYLRFETPLTTESQ